MLFEHLFVSPVVEFDELEVLHKVEILHGLDHILAIDSLALLQLRYLAALARDESDELTDAFLYTFACLF